MVQKNKAEKLKSSLHLVDFPKQNTHIQFVSSYGQIKRENRLKRDADMGEDDAPIKLNEKFATKARASQLERDILKMQSENKQQYKRLADAIGKATQYERVQDAL